MIGLTSDQSERGVCL